MLVFSTHAGVIKEMHAFDSASKSSPVSVLTSAFLSEHIFVAANSTHYKYLLMKSS